MNGTAQILVFRSDERLFGIDVARIKRVVRAVDCTPLPQAPGIALGIINVQGQIIPLLSMRKRLSLAEREIRPDDCFIIAVASDRTVALLVDEVRGIVERPASSITAAPTILPDLEQIDGVLQLEDGLIVIQDLDRFLSIEERNALEGALERIPSHGS